MLLCILLSTLLMVTPTILAQGISDLPPFPLENITVVLTMSGFLPGPPGVTEVSTYLESASTTSTVALTTTVQNTITIIPPQINTICSSTRIPITSVISTPTSQSANTGQPVPAIPGYAPAPIPPVRRFMARRAVELRSEGAKQDQKHQTPPEITENYVDNQGEYAYSLPHSYSEIVVCQVQTTANIVETCVEYAKPTTVTALPPYGLNQTIWV